MLLNTTNYSTVRDGSPTSGIFAARSTLCPTFCPTGREAKFMEEAFDEK